ncbi:hypothetical protein FRC07_006478 [Ceratobasidium sp. 392]|nr:hypothetical protein FRC07_006478 [Ceratobasidium sp. 392]
MDDLNSSTTSNHHRPTPDAMSVTEPFSFGSRNTLAAAALVFALLVVLVLTFVRRRPSSRRSTVLVLGPSDAGKTAIHTSLAFGHALPSHTSIQANSTLYTTPTGRTLQIVDVPGHPRLREQFTDHLADTAGIVFVVDAATVSRNGAAVAEHLHLVLRALAALPASQQTPPLLIHAHKSDLIPKQQQQQQSVAIQRVTAVLERELEKRRAAQTGGVGVEGLGEANEDADGNGLDCSGGVFKFSEWEGGSVEFGEGWVKVVREDGIANEKISEKEDASENGLESLREWIGAL